MFLILAIEPDRRQANRLFALGRGQLRGAELVIVDNIEAGLDVLAGRVPDLVLTSLLLSAKDDAALADRLRELDAAGHQVQTLVVPLFAGPTSQGCQPPVFAAQINEYLENLRLDREAREPLQPYSPPAATLHRQPTVEETHREIAATAKSAHINSPRAVPEIEARPIVESPRLIAPTPIVHARVDTTRAPIEPLEPMTPEPVTEPARVIAPAAVTPPREVAVAPPAARPAATARPAAPAGRAATAAKPRPKVTKVRVAQPPLDEDPEVAKFMAALRGLPDAQVVDTRVEAAALEAEAAPDHDIDVSLSLDEEPAPLSAHVEAAAAAAETNTEPARDVEAPVREPKTVKALKPTRARAATPATPKPAAPPALRKRLTPIQRVARPAAAAPIAPPGGDEEAAAAPATPPVKVVGRIQPASASPAAAAAPRQKDKKIASRGPRPIQDEWGFFDPDQCGFPAVQAALEEIEEPDLFRKFTKPNKPRS